MIYIRIELWPFGNHRQAKLLGEMVVANVGGDADMGEYDIRASVEGGFEAQPHVLPSLTQSNRVRTRLSSPKPESVLATGHVRHRRADGFWLLLKRSLTEMIAVMELAKVLPKYKETTDGQDGQSEGGTEGDGEDRKDPA